MFAYAEIGLGSKRTRYFNQHTYLAEAFKAKANHLAASKYGASLFSSLPFHRGNGNGLISFLPAEISVHYLRKSRKKLLQICTTDACTYFIVHLPLVSADRLEQLNELAQLVNRTRGNVVVGGDFNIFNGIDEIKILKEKTGLQLAGDGKNTFPSHRPRIQLDIFLYRFDRADLRPSVRTLPHLLSDHLPIVLEW